MSRHAYCVKYDGWVTVGSRWGTSIRQYACPVCGGKVVSPSTAARRKLVSKEDARAHTNRRNREFHGRV